MAAFKILHKDGKARVGELTTPHGVIETPNFIPVGTQGTVKAISPSDLKEIGVQVVLANTYHLMLRPGEKLIKKLGGLHQFMGWSGPIMTDSGGFQVFSLGVALEHGVGKLQRKQDSIETPQIKPRLNKVTEEGVTFQSHLDGTKYFLSPEKSIEIQHTLGVDLIVAFDDHESSKYSRSDLIKSMELTEKWELRSLKALKKLKSHQIMYGVVHGSIDKELRIRSAQFTDQHFDAIAIGGIYLYKKNLYQIIEWTVAQVSEEKPKHLLGIGEVEDLLNGVERGIDLFDCVAPTRRARNGSLYVFPNATISIMQAKYTTDKKPIDPKCNCYTCQNFSRAYLRHLFMAKELLYHQLATIHNLYFINNLMSKIRESIKKGKFKKVKENFLGSP